MIKSLPKVLTVTAALVVICLCTLASFDDLPWVTVLAEDFNECRINSFNVIKADVGYFVVEDPNSVIKHEVAANLNGYIVFNDQFGENLEDSVLFGVPDEKIIEDKLFLEFELCANQENSCFSAVLSDEDDLDVLLLSVRDNGNWFVNDVDLGIPYSSGIGYLLSVMIEVDPLGGPALYSIHYQEKDKPETYDLLDAGLIQNFLYGQTVGILRFEKPCMTPSGRFVLDNVLMQLVVSPISQGGSNLRGN
jgi:hypothetical protein